MFQHPIIAALRNRADLDLVCGSRVDTIFMMCGELSSIAADTARCQAEGKTVFIHIDLIKGLAPDREGVEFLARQVRPGGLVSTKTHLIKAARDFGLATVHHLFIIDTQALKTGLKNVRDSKPDAVEIMPGLMPRIIREVAEDLRQPIVAAGLIRDLDEVQTMLEAGCAAISTGTQSLWSCIPGRQLRLMARGA